MEIIFHVVFLSFISAWYLWMNSYQNQMVRFIEIRQKLLKDPSSIPSVHCIRENNEKFWQTRIEWRSKGSFMDICEADKMRLNHPRYYKMSVLRSESIILKLPSYELIIFR